MKKQKKLTATTLAKMSSRATFGVVRGSQVVPNKRKRERDWRKEIEES